MCYVVIFVLKIEAQHADLICTITVQVQIYSSLAERAVHNTNEWLLQERNKVERAV